ncbi:MAG TPA: imidazole glycerol phosphate synthase subunit HisH [Puia sp.]|nr:imidazole glycerol phosphate synthase subunit HisH [Puia sp.]
MLVIVDYGVGNLASIKNMLGRADANALISSEKKDILSASGIILPGIGAFDHCMEMFHSSGLREIITKRVLEEGIPILGICVGLQMMMESSEEGIKPGLGWIHGDVIKFRRELIGNLKIPHMGWTEVTIKKESYLSDNFLEEPRFYFVHSFHVRLKDPTDELMTAKYGYDFTAAIQRNNIFGVQFHPEKSHKFGMRLLRNFAAISYN